MHNLNEEGIYEGEILNLEDGNLELDITLTSEGSGISELDNTIIFITRKCNPVNIFVIRFGKLVLMRMNGTNDFLGNNGIYSLSIKDYFFIGPKKQTVLFISVKTKVNMCSIE
ncbi:hypothetical protein [Cytobacillus gottheilii]|uniref:hypothetical protein n=1 Tax=Cytobacillus gottheilii TaxID=859144 RepID=UPI000832059B|nr:hypothetical protein [Cytobacillus gottheilii]